MIHQERNAAKRFDSPDRSARFTDLVYGCDGRTPEEVWRDLRQAEEEFYPSENPYRLLFGDLHGHTNLSDGQVDVDTFFQNLRDAARVDFCALSDHDHGGVARPPLWAADPVSGRSKWEICLQKSDAYYQPGRFTTLPAYERDSYPWFSNMVIYYRSSRNARMVRGERDGEITARELEALYAREDVLYGPHTCSMVSPGCDLNGRMAAHMPKTFEIYSRGGAYEYYDNPFPAADGIRGCNYIDALENGAHPACIACSDDHRGFGGRDVPDEEAGYTGMTGLYAMENTREAVFDALKARRTYAFMGQERVELDFRINGRFMGEIFCQDEDKRAIYFAVGGKVPAARVDIIKNGRSVAFYQNRNRALLFDYTQEREEDYYYLRVLLKDGRYAWSSPIWVRR